MSSPEPEVEDPSLKGSVLSNSASWVFYLVPGSELPMSQLNSLQKEEVSFLLSLPLLLPSLSPSLSVYR